MDQYKEPLIPNPEVCLPHLDEVLSSSVLIVDTQVHIVLPALSTLMTVSARLAKISTTLHASSNHQGEFRLSVTSDQANVQTEWRGLSHPKMTAPDDPSQVPQPVASGSGQANGAAAARGGKDDMSMEVAEEEVVDQAAFVGVTIEHKSFAKFLAAHSIADTVIACESFILLQSSIKLTRCFIF